MASWQAQITCMTHRLRQRAERYHQAEGESIGRWYRRYFGVSRISLMSSSPPTLFVQQAGDHQRHDLPFVEAERRITLWERLQLRLECERGPASLKRLLDGGQQHVVVKWLHQKLDGSGFHRP